MIWHSGLKYNPARQAGPRSQSTDAPPAHNQRMAGADVAAVRSIEPAQRTAARHAIDLAFVAAFRRVLLSAAALALPPALVGALLRPQPRS